MPLFSPNISLVSKAYDVASKIVASSIYIPLPIVAVMIGGFASAGDGGEALYKRVASQPSHAGKFQSLDGSWFEIADSEIKLKMFGAKGDNSTDDTQALADFVNYLNQSTTVSKGFVTEGLYKATSLPTITSSITIEGENPRTCQIVISGSTDFLKVYNAAGRVDSFNLKNIGLNGNAMTNGYVVSFTWTQNVLLDNVYIIDPFKGANIRQSGNVRFENCIIDAVRDTGVYAFGNNTTINGQNDQIDCIIFAGTTIQSNYVPGGAVNNSKLLVLDGRVHTVETNGLRLLSGGRGLVTQNTAGLASNFTPRFILGSDLEVESMYYECVDLQYCLDFWPDSFYAVGSATADGVKLSANVASFRPKGGTINSNYFNGIFTNGCQFADLSGLAIYNNSLVGAGLKHGVYASGAGTLQGNAGIWGKATWLPAYTELQGYGLCLDGAFSGSVCISGVDLRGNNIGPISDNGTTTVNSFVRNCPGYNSIGPSSITVGASPFNYTSGLTQETLNIRGGTVSSVVINGVILAVATNTTVVVNPRQTVTITYSATPTLISNKQ